MGFVPNDRAKAVVDGVKKFLDERVIPLEPLLVREGFVAMLPKLAELRAEAKARSLWAPFLPESLGWIWFLLKVSAILFFYVWMRWTLPRYRYDQLMAFGWKVLLPLAVVNLLVTAAAVLYFAA